MASGTNFLTGVIIGRTVPKAEFGFYMLGFTLLVLAVNLEGALISTPYTVYSPRLDEEGRARYTGSTLIHVFGLAAAMVLCLAFAGAAISIGVGSAELATVIWALAGAMPFVLLREYVRRVCFARLQITVALLIDSCVAAVQLGGLLLLASLGLLSAAWAYCIIGLACGLVGLGWLAAMRGRVVLRRAGVVADFKRNLSIGKWVAGSALAREASSGSYPWFLAAFHGAGATAALGACSSVVMLANPFVAAVMNLLLPTAAHASARDGPQALNRVVVRSTALFVVVLGVFFVAILAVGGWLVPALYGPGYVGYGWLVSLLALNFLIRSAAFPVNSGLLAMERPDIIFKSHLAGAVVTLLLGTPLVWVYGLHGAAVAILAKSTVTAAVRLRAYWANYRRLAGGTNAED